MALVTVRRAAGSAGGPAVSAGRGRDRDRDRGTPVAEAVWQGPTRGRRVLPGRGAGCRRRGRAGGPGSARAVRAEAGGKAAPVAPGGRLLGAQLPPVHVGVSSAPGWGAGPPCEHFPPGQHPAGGGGTGTGPPPGILGLIPRDLSPQWDPSKGPHAPPRGPANAPCCCGGEFGRVSLARGTCWGGTGPPPHALQEEDAPRRGKLQRRQSFVMVKGAALLLPAEEPLAAEPPPAAPPGQAPGRQEQHLQLMMQLLRPQDAIRLAVRLESARPRRVRYLLVVRPEEAGAEGQTALLGVDFAHEGATRCTLGMVLPLWSDTQVFLDGDGGFSVTSGGQTRIFKPISVQTMWAVLQELHRACEEASRGGHIPGGPALAWARSYAAALASEQSCLNEWLAMADLESVRPASPPPLRPAAPELSEQAVRALLRDVMATADLESVTSKEVREELERRTGHSLAQHKDFIDNEMLLVLAQMDRPSRVFPHLYLGSEWNAANLEELQQNRVTHILNVAREIDNFFPALFTYMNVRVYDEETAQLLPHWNDTFLFLSRVRAGGGRALVHCRMGLSRSAATVLAYAMKEFGWPLERALRHVRHCRPGVLPNPGFMRQLDFYQGILHASRHSSLWEPKAAERAAQPEEGPEAARGDEGGLSPAPSPQPLQEASGPGLLGASRRPRISLCAVMRSISQLESPEPPELLGEPLAGEVFAAAEAPGGLGGVPGGPGGAPGGTRGARPSSRPRRVVRQASLDGGPAPASDHAPTDGYAPPAPRCDSAPSTTSDPASCPTPASDPTPSADPAPHLPSTPPPAP
ncbi:LOW QUALITY PROTEIN: protein phosphatase Slingshot homolog 3 [Sarcoramphus papa]